MEGRMSNPVKGGNGSNGSRKTALELQLTLSSVRRKEKRVRQLILWKGVEVLTLPRMLLHTLMDMAILCQKLLTFPVESQLKIMICWKTTMLHWQMIWFPQNGWNGIAVKKELRSEGN